MTESQSQLFAGQNVVVTGGTRGLGRAMVEDFLEGGARVLATYRSNEQAAEELREACAAHGDRLSLHSFDVADHSACEAFWDGLSESLEGGVQVLVNNSGIRRDGLLATMKPADWSAVLQTNLTGSWNMAQFAVRDMARKRYGRIIFVTSPAGLFGFEGQTNYSASKAGQIGLARSLSKEVARRKITVNCVSPGFIGTDLIADLPEEVADGYKK
ncbi:MAG: SDR family NAD(P)-dependent oxidoreductase, partial [Planctomycetota bacterium]